MVNQSSSPARLIAIDAFRAVTMLLMIFVNDFWTLKDIPIWLEHAQAADDALGFSDIIFPVFLFIVGLSIPLAIQNRLKKNVPVFKIFQHILLRSLALLIIGICHVNLENYSDQAWLARPIWTILITISFFLIWLDYPKNAKKTSLVLQISGLVLLGGLLLIYKGDSPEGLIWMRPQWWGILGLIGWSYLLVSLIFLFTKGKLIIQFAALIFFLLFNCATNLGWLQPLNHIREYVWIIGDGSMPALVMAGLITFMFYSKGILSDRRFWIYIAVISITMILFGLFTRPLWGISKIRATPSWTTICIGISALSFALMVFLMDLKGIKGWYNWIKPAGVSTLTCYLLPYIHVAFLQMIEFRLPPELRTGGIGLTKSFIFSLIIIQIVGFLQKQSIRLKL